MVVNIMLCQKQKNIMKFITQRVSTVLLLTSLQGLFLVFFDGSFAADDQDISHIRLDAHPTPENSVLFTFDGGGPGDRRAWLFFGALARRYSSPEFRKGVHDKLRSDPLVTDNAQIFDRIGM